MRPLWWVKEFYKLSRTVEFDLIGFLELELLNFKVGSSTGFQKRFKFEKPNSLDNV